MLGVVVMLFFAGLLGRLGAPAHHPGRSRYAIAVATRRDLVRLFLLPRPGTADGGVMAAVDRRRIRPLAGDARGRRSARAARRLRASGRWRC